MIAQSERIGFFINKIFICDMLKRIPKSDISIRPFKAYKEWNFNQSSTEVSILEANISSSELTNGIPKNSLYGQLRAQFYNGNEFNPILRVGDIRNTYDANPVSMDRFISDNAKVIAVPQIYVGEGIKKGSVVLVDDGDKTYIDDKYGNLIDATGDTIVIEKIDIQTNVIQFVDIASGSYTASFQTSIGDFDLVQGTFNLRYNGENYDMQIISYDNETSKMIVDNIPFLEGPGSVSKIGNIFYANGLFVITKYAESHFTSSWDLSYKSTETIYEHEYLLVVNKDEFNVSQNPSAIVEVKKEVSYVTGSDGKIYNVTTNPGIKYIRKKTTLDNGNVLDFRYTSSVNSSTFAGFEHYDLSGSIDSTGSFLSPFITTIGLYDEDMDLVAVAKLPQPIKSEPDIPINFIIRFDT